MTLEQMRARVAEIQARMRELYGDGQRSFTPEDQAEWDNLLTEFNQLKTDIENENQSQNRSNAFQEVNNWANQRQTNPIYQDPGQGNDPGEPEVFRHFGEYLYAVRYNQHDERLQRVTVPVPEGRTMQAGVGAAGGFLVPQQYSDQILQVDPQAALIRPRATVIPAGNPPDASITFPALDQSGARGVYSGVTVQWIAEGADKPETEPKFAEITLTPKEVAAYIAVTDKLLRNSEAAGSIVQTLLRRAIIASEDDAFFSGNGAGRPFGFLNHQATIPIQRTAANQIAYADIINMFARVMFGGSLVWMASRTVLPQLMSMVDPAGNLIWQPNAREGAPGTLLGIPVLLNERNPVLGARGDLALVDLTYYLIKDGSGIFIDASPHPRFTQNQTIIKAFWNVDGQPWMRTPLLLEDGVTTVSPFVVLE